MLEENDPQMAKMLSLVGGVAVSFAVLENTLDVCIQALYHHWGANEIVSEIPRTAMNKKIEFMETVFGDGSPMSGFIPGILDIVRSIDRCANHRHQIIHGVARTISGKMQFTRYSKTDTGSFRSATATVEAKDVEELIEHIIRLNMALIEVASFLAFEPLPNEGDQAAGEGTV